MESNPNPNPNPKPDPLSKFLERLSNIELPENPLDITDEQLNAVSKILSMVMMMNMARTSAVSAIQTYPPTYDYEIAKLQTTIDDLTRRVERLEAAVIQLNDMKMNRQ